MRRWIVIGTLAASATALAACGDASSTGDGQEVAELTTGSPALEPTTNPVASDPPSTEASGSEASPTDPAGSPPDSAEAGATAPPTTAPPTTGTDATTIATTTVPSAELGGRAFAEAVQPGSEIETNLLPDLVVDDVRRGAKANLRNVFPADRPVLFWMYAPH